MLMLSMLCFLSSLQSDVGDSLLYVLGGSKRNGVCQVNRMGSRKNSFVGSSIGSVANMSDLASLHGSSGSHHSSKGGNNSGLWTAGGGGGSGSSMGQLTGSLAGAGFGSASGGLVVRPGSRLSVHLSRRFTAQSVQVVGGRSGGFGRSGSEQLSPGRCRAAAAAAGTAATAGRSPRSSLSLPSATLPFPTSTSLGDVTLNGEVSGGLDCDSTGVRGSGARDLSESKGAGIRGFLPPPSQRASMPQLDFAFTSEQRDQMRIHPRPSRRPTPAPFKSLPGSACEKSDGAPASGGNDAEREPESRFMGPEAGSSRVTSSHLIPIAEAQSPVRRLSMSSTGGEGASVGTTKSGSHVSGRILSRLSDCSGCPEATNSSTDNSAASSEQLVPPADATAATAAATAAAAAPEASEDPLELHAVMKKVLSDQHGAPSDADEAALVKGRDDSPEGEPPGGDSPGQCVTTPPLPANLENSSVGTEQARSVVTLRSSPFSSKDLQTLDTPQIIQQAAENLRDGHDPVSTLEFRNDPNLLGPTAPIDTNVDESCSQLRNRPSDNESGLVEREDEGVEEEEDEGLETHGSFHDLEEALSFLWTLQAPPEMNAEQVRAAQQLTFWSYEQGVIPHIAGTGRGKTGGATDDGSQQAGVPGQGREKQKQRQHSRGSEGQARSCAAAAKMYLLSHGGGSSPGRTKKECPAPSQSQPMSAQKAAASAPPSPSFSNMPSFGTSFAVASEPEGEEANDGNAASTDRPSPSTPGTPGVLFARRGKRASTCGDAELATGRVYIIPTSQKQTPQVVSDDNVIAGRAGVALLGNAPVEDVTHQTASITDSVKPRPILSSVIELQPLDLCAAVADLTAGIPEAYSTLQLRPHPHPSPQQQQQLSLTLLQQQEQQLEDQKSEIEDEDEEPSQSPSWPLFEEVEMVLSGAHEWQFDIFRLNEVTHGHPLSTLAFFLFQESGLIATFDLSGVVLAR